MYLHSTRGRFTPQNTDFIFHSLSSDYFVSALARRCTSLLVSSIVEPVCSAPRAACVSLPFRVCCEYPCVLGRLAPRARCVCIPCRTCRVFSFYFHPLLPVPALHSPARSFPSSPCVQSIFVCVPTPYVSAASPCALVRTVFHIPSSLPLSRDANPLVTCIFRVQLGCSGHPHTHISHSHPPRRELLTI